MILVIATQHYENYAWREDGTLGTGKDAYWKAKGGDNIKVTGLTGAEDLDAVVDCVRGEIEMRDEGFMVNIIGYGLEADDWMSDFEKSQLEWEGKITYREREINWPQVVEEIMA
jgi:hypothetical protein